jgi:hypothetical protein
VDFIYNDNEQFFFHTTSHSTENKYDIDGDYLGINSKHFKLNNAENDFFIEKLAKSNQTIKSLVKNIIFFANFSVKHFFK